MQTTLPRFGLNFTAPDGMIVHLIGTMDHMAAEIGKEEKARASYVATKPASNVRPLYRFSTRLEYIDVVTTGGDSSSEAVDMYTRADPVTITNNALRMSPLVERINLLSAVSDGWKGEGSVAPSSRAKEEALVMLDKIVGASPSRRPPLIGLDEDGTFSFAWRSEDLKGHMTIYGDGTCSFSIKSSHSSARSSSTSVYAPLPADLVKIFMTE